MKHIIPEYELAEISNLGDITLSEISNSIIKEKIFHRRKRINQLRLAGYTNQQIAEKIGCNLSTVEKDLKTIRENTRKWFEAESIKDFCQSLQDSIILYDNATEELQILYADCDNLDDKLKILSKISEFEERKTVLYQKTKSVNRYLGDQNVK